MIKSLNPRERLVVLAGLAVLGLLLAWFALINPYLQTISSLDRRIKAQQRNLLRAQQMQGQILQLREQLQHSGARPQGNRPLFAQVEALTEQTGVRGQLLSMRPQPAAVQGDYRQQLVDVRFEKLSLEQLVKLLHAVEYRSGGVQVKSLRVKPRFEDRSSLDVSLTLMSMEKS